MSTQSILAEFDKKFGYLVMDKPLSGTVTTKYVRERDKRIKSFLAKAIETAKEEEMNKVIRWLTNYVNTLHSILYEELKDIIDYDNYSNDYKHGILRGYTLIGRYLDSLNRKD